MSQFAARTTLRKAVLVHGRGGNSDMFVRSISSAVIKSPADITNPTRIHDWGGVSRDLNWKLRMSSASGTENKDENPTAKKNQNGGGPVVVPSYWGRETTKMKISRKDGSDWPWNCFMVKLIFILNFVEKFKQFI